MKKYPSVTVKILLKYNDQILILKDKDGAFTFPGGRMEWKESILGALQRELKEELDYSLEKEPKLFDVWNYISKDGGRHYVMIYYAKQLDKKPKFTSLEGAEMLWLTKEKFIKMDIIKDREFVDKMFGAKI